MANLHRGEIEAELDGAKHSLVLTLGALAELEAAFGDADMLALAARFESGRLASRDCILIIGAGLRGAGHAITNEEVADMQTGGGIAGFVDIVARLLSATFGVATGGVAASSDAGTSKAGTSKAGTSGTGGGVEARGPFPGTT